MGHGITEKPIVRICRQTAFYKFVGKKDKITICIEIDNNFHDLEEQGKWSKLVLKRKEQYNVKMNEGR